MIGEIATYSTARRAIPVSECVLLLKSLGEHVKRILRFLDLDDTKVRSKIKPTQITSMFEKSNDELDVRFIVGHLI